MKKATIVFGAFIMMAIGAKAQHLSLGPTAGFGHSFLSDGDGDTKNRFHPSYNIGGKLVYSTLTNWGFSLDAKYSGEGGTIGDNSDDKLKLNLNYIRVPLQAIYFFGKVGNAIRPKVSLGPSFGFLVGGKIKNYTNGSVVAEVKAKDYVKSFDLGINGAVGLNFRIAKATWLNADISYTHGLTNISKIAGDDNSLKQRNLGLNLGVLFPIGK